MPVRHDVPRRSLHLHAAEQSLLLARLHEHSLRPEQLQRVRPSLHGRDHVPAGTRRRRLHVCRHEQHVPGQQHPDVRQPLGRHQQLRDLRAQMPVGRAMHVGCMQLRSERDGRHHPMRSAQRPVHRSVDRPLQLRHLRDGMPGGHDLRRRRVRLQRLAHALRGYVRQHVGRQRELRRLRKRMPRKLLVPERSLRVHHGLESLQRRLRRREHEFEQLWRLRRGLHGRECVVMDMYVERDDGERGVRREVMRHELRRLRRQSDERLRSESELRRQSLRQLQSPVSARGELHRRCLRVPRVDADDLRHGARRLRQHEHR